MEFRFTKEIVCHDSQPCDGERHVGMALSQGGQKAVHKVDPDLLSNDIVAFSNRVETYFRDRTLDVVFSYRMRIGVKKSGHTRLEAISAVRGHGVRGQNLASAASGLTTPHVR